MIQTNSSMAILHSQVIPLSQAILLRQGIPNRLQGIPNRVIRQFNQDSHHLRNPDLTTRHRLMVKTASV